MNPGDKVTYTPQVGKPEQGIIKSINQYTGCAFVVYKCNNDWANYMNYTGCSTVLTDLTPGWENDL